MSLDISTRPRLVAFSSAIGTLAAGLSSSLSIVDDFSNSPIIKLAPQIIGSIPCFRVMKSIYNSSFVGAVTALTTCAIASTLKGVYGRVGMVSGIALGTSGLIGSLNNDIADNNDFRVLALTTITSIYSSNMILLAVGNRYDNPFHHVAVIAKYTFLSCLVSFCSMSFLEKIREPQRQNLNI
jgi:hypothetical protein